MATAWFRLCDPELADTERARFAELYPDLLETFAAPRGGIVTAYFCRHIGVAAVLTDAEAAAENPDRVLSRDVEDSSVDRHDRVPTEANGHRHRRGHGRARRLPGLKPPEASSSAIHIEPIFGDPEDWKAKEILFTCLELHYRALEFLTPKPRKICLRMIFCVITALLGASGRAQGSRRRLAGRHVA